MAVSDTRAARRHAKRRDRIDRQPSVIDEYDDERSEASEIPDAVVTGEIIPGPRHEVAEITDIRRGEEDLYQATLPLPHAWFPAPHHTMIHGIARPVANPDHHPLVRWVPPNWHRIWPGGVALGWEALGWWCATVPSHVTYGALETSAGVSAIVAGALAHHRHAAGADSNVVRGLFLGGVTLFAGGMGATFGANPYSVSATALLAGGTYVVRHLAERAQLREAREYHVALTEAANGGATALATGEGRDPFARRTLADEIVYAFELAGFPGLVINGSPRRSDHGWEVVANLPRGAKSTPEDVNAKARQIATNLGVRRVKIEPTQFAHVIRVTAYNSEKNPTEATIPWPGAQVDDITKPIPIGLNSVGEIVYLTIYQRHTLYGGRTTGGKSGGINTLVCSVAATKNAIAILIDLKPGQLELGPYEDVAYKSARNVRAANLLINGVVAAMTARGWKLKAESRKRGEPVRDWDPNNPGHGPQIIIVVDELAELFRLDKDVFKPFLRLMQVARALGITVVAATQSPSAKASGDTTDATGQFVNVVCFQTRNSTQTNVILGQGAHGDGWVASARNLPLQGMFLPMTPEYTEPEVCRGYWVESSEVMNLTRPYVDSRPDLDEFTASVLEFVLRGGDADGVVATIEDLAEQYEDVDDFEAELIAAMSGSAPRGSGPSGGPRGGRSLEDAFGFMDDEPTHTRLRVVPTAYYPDGETPVGENEARLWRALGELPAGEWATVASLAELARRQGHEHQSVAWVRKMVARWRDPANGFVEAVHERGEWRVRRVDPEAFRLRRREA